jgi:MFS family permease
MLWSANIAYILEGSAKEFGMNGIEIGLLGSCFPLGLMIGAFIWGLVGDKYGRMYAFKPTVCISAFFSLMLTVSVHPGMSGVALVFLGFGIGGELSLGGTVFCEFCPPSKAYYLTVLGIFWAVGGTVSALIAFMIVMTNNTSIYDWRYIVGSSFVIEVGCMIFRFFMEETPAFSILSGQVEKTEKILNNISIQNTGKNFFLDNQLKSVDKPILNSKTEEVGTKSSKEILKKLFSGNNLKLVIFFGVVFFS